jgi:hypothetical protein
MGSGACRAGRGPDACDPLPIWLAPSLTPGSGWAGEAYQLVEERPAQDVVQKLSEQARTASVAVCRCLGAA